MNAAATVGDVLPDETAELLKRLADKYGQDAERLAESAAERNAAIVEASRAGASTQEIGDAVSMSKVGVWKIIQKADKQS